MRFSPYDWSEKDMIGGSAALDFINTASHWASGDPVDRLGGPEGFGAWAAAAGLLSKADMARLKKELAADPKPAAKIFAEAVELRSALWRIFSALAADDDVSEADLEILDESKIRAARCCRLAPDGKGGFRRRCADETPALESALRLIVEAAEELLLNGRLDRLHACGGDHCEWMFLDLSKNGRRRWCSMATCGNDAKVKKFRKRTKEAA